MLAVAVNIGYARIVREVDQFCVHYCSLNAGYFHIEREEQFCVDYSILNLVFSSVLIFLL